MNRGVVLESLQRNVTSHKAHRDLVKYNATLEVSGQVHLSPGRVLGIAK